MEWLSLEQEQVTAAVLEVAGWCDRNMGRTVTVTSASGIIINGAN